VSSNVIKKSSQRMTDGSLGRKPVEMMNKKIKEPSQSGDRKQRINKNISYIKQVKNYIATLAGA
jgi:hypothetical protein